LLTIVFTVNQTIQLFVLDGNNYNPVFVSKIYSANIPEEMPIGSSVVAVTATDRDTSDQLTYTIVTSTINFYADSVYAGNVGVIKISQVLNDVMINNIISYG